MPTMVESWLELAGTLLQDHPRSGGLRRRAVSTAYYAVFHTIARICAEELAPDHDRDSPEYVMVYRSLEHAGVLKALTSGPLMTDPQLQRIGSGFKQLQEGRLDADYLPPYPGALERSRAEELLQEAKLLIAQLDALPARARQTLVVRLLIKDPRR